jgi:hypothetical protein
MKLNISAMAGEALHFAARRFETVVRVSFMPLALGMVFSMAAMFSLVSVANGRFLTFADLSDGARYEMVQEAAGQAIVAGVSTGSVPVYLILGLIIIMNAVLVASFMAPLIRYSGLGEKPAAGLLRVPFGAAQARYIGASAATGLSQLILGLAPGALASAYIFGTIQKVASGAYAHFPDPDSLHTVDYVTAADALALRGSLWIYQYGLFAAGAGALGLLIVAILFLHYSKASDGAAMPLGSRLAATFGTIALFAATPAILYLGFALLVTLSFDAAIGAFFALFADPAQASMIAFGLAAFGVASYIAARVAAYPAIAVANGSMKFAGLFRLTRGGNIVRLTAAGLIIALVLLFMQVMLNAFGFNWLLAALFTIGQLAESVTRLAIGDGVASAVASLTAGAVALSQIAFNLLWAMFTYGVAAGFYGRMYRDSRAA